MSGSKGSAHSRDYRVVDKILQYVTPAKALAMTCIDLLYDEAAKANEIIKEFEPTIPPKEYVEFMHKFIS